MDLSVESCKYVLCQIVKTVKIFENVAFSGSHFLKAHTCIYCKLETYLFLTLSLLVIVYASLLPFRQTSARKRGIEIKFTK